MGLAVLLGLPVGASGAADRITGPVNYSRSRVIPGNVHPLAQARFDQGVADAGAELNSVTLLLRPDSKLQPFLLEQMTPGSANYRKWLTPEQFAGRFGLSDGDIAKLRTWLESQGLHIGDVARGRHWITFSGTAENIGKALHTEFHRYRSDGVTHIANAWEPSVPEAFGNVVAGFRGLNDFRPEAQRPSPTPVPNGADPAAGAPSPKYDSNGYHYLAPGDLTTLYDLQPIYSAQITGAGETIVVIGESGIYLSDITIFRQYYRLPVNNPKLMLFGPDPGIQPGPLGEADLDLEWAGAIAPKATIVYAYAQDIYTALQYAVDQDLGKVISLSFGRCELGETSAFEAVAQQANAQGITIVAASGDSGAATCDRNNVSSQASTGLTASWPASFPEVTAVGGTELNEGGGQYWATSNGATGGSVISYVPEMPWNDSAVTPLAAGGGGPSALFPKPAWQAGPGVPNDGARDLPDISLTASWDHDPYLVESFGTLSYNGGTSASTQVFAGMLALLNQYLISNGTLSAPGLGNINPALYRMAQSGSPAFHDITSGDNRVSCTQGTAGCVDGLLGFAAGPGYDMATGLGSIDFNLLASTWNRGPAATVTLTANPASAAPGATVQLAATVTGTGKSAPTGSVAFTVDGAPGINTAQVSTNTGTGELPVGSATLDASGTASLSAPASLLSLGSGTIRAVYSGDLVYDSSAGAAMVTVNYPQTGASAVVPLITPNPVMEDGFGGWPYDVALVERAGVATTLTSFTVDGTTQNLTFWNSTRIPANGAIFAELDASISSPPANRVFSFSGRDANGQTWTQQVSVPFLAGPATTFVPGISLTTPLPLVAQNPQAPSNCQWTQQISVQETGGFLTQLTAMSVNGADTTSQIPNIFGATRLAPYGFLQGTLCFSNTGVTQTKLTGASLSGTYNQIVTATISATMTAASNAPPSLSSPQNRMTVSLSADATGTVAPAAIPVSFGGGSPAWTVTMTPANQASRWLTVSPMSGTGAGTVNLSASAAGLSPGAYTAVLSIGAAAAQPQVANVVVTLTVGGASAMSIAGLVNNFSGGLTAAPGMVAAVFGTDLAPAGTALQASGLPLPFSLAGVSATVNGVSAPLYYASPGQVNVQIPYETGAGTAVLAINNNGQVAALPFSVAATAPGLFPAAIDNLSGAEVSAVSAGQVLLLFMTGEGDVTPGLGTGAGPYYSTDPTTYPQPRQPLTLTVGGVATTPLFQAIPFGLAGVTQIDFIVPASLAPGAVQAVVTVGGVAAPPINLTVATATSAR